MLSKMLIVFVFSSTLFIVLFVKSRHATLYSNFDILQFEHFLSENEDLK